MRKDVFTCMVVLWICTNALASVEFETTLFTIDAGRRVFNCTELSASVGDSERVRAFVAFPNDWLPSPKVMLEQRIASEVGMFRVQIAGERIFLTSNQVVLMMPASERECLVFVGSMPKDADRDRWMTEFLGRCNREATSE